MILAHTLAALGVAVAAALVARPEVLPPAPRVAVLTVEPHNLTGRSEHADDPAHLRALTAALRGRLSGACGYEVAAVDTLAEARGRVGPGYFYAHPDAGAVLARDAGADWVLIPRLNRASPWVTDLQLHVVRAADGAVVSNRVVELKGFGMSDDLTVRLTERGAAWMADQVDQAIGWAAAPGAPPPRHCPA